MTQLYLEYIIPLLCHWNTYFEWVHHSCSAFINVEVPLPQNMLQHTCRGDQQQQAHVTPLLKKSSLDKEVFKNYRPVSNLNFISKILESVVAIQLQTHLDEAGLLTAFQSAYRQHHSTESALLNIHNDILLNMAKGSVTALTLLDLSAAFDTIDHTILLDRLKVYYGISELALGWFRSYLSGRTHSVKVGSTLSHPAPLQYGVPQGSVLGPILFSLYTNPISSIIHSHSSIDYHFYADDTQLYITLSPANFSHSIQKLNNCLMTLRISCLQIN